MQWDSNLQAQAQQWANYLAQINNLQHDPNAGAGENIASEPNSDDVLTHSTRDWASEVNGYTYGPCDGSSGHYTQVSISFQSFT
jgi:hypothetical protein